MFLKVGNMAYDVKIREGRYWEIIELLRSEESESNTSGAQRGAPGIPTD